MRFFFSAVAFATATFASAIPGSTLKARADCTVDFEVLETTAWGEFISVVGSISQLGTWNSADAVALSASGYTSSNPLWAGTVSLPAGTTFQYKYIKWGTDGSLTWEADPNHSYTVPSSCSGTISVDDTWQATSSSTSSSTTTTTTATSSATSSSTSSTSATGGATTSGDTATCTNGPTSRGCWDSTTNISTDFDTNWPNTGNTVYYTFTLTNITLSPDGYPRPVLAINGQYPGPTINANWGDMISITVVNQLPNNGTSIHWHGLRHWHANSQDGVPGVTECPIAPGNSKTYLFQATQYGTSWYHSHFSCQYGDGVVGPIVIQGPATANYDIDLGAMPISDWFYPTVATLAGRVEHENALPPSSDNVLINGSMTSVYGGSYAQTPLATGKKHRLRLVNMSVDNHVVVSLDGHSMEVIAADFVPIVPYNSTNIFIGIGQRYDVIITANQSPGAYWFRVEVQDSAGCGSDWNNGNIQSIFSYTGHDTETPESTATTYSQRCTDETDLVPYWDSYVPVGEMSNPTTLATAINQSTAADGSITVYWNVNSTPLKVAWETPTLEMVRAGNTNYAATANVITLPTANTWTYWVIQAAAGSPFTVNVPHPIHLHGHDFYVLGTGSGTYSSSEVGSLNYDNPTRRDVAMLNSGGWLAIAFVTDNPGAWLMHCHIAWHADEGLAVQFLEQADQILSVDPLPSDFDSQCSAWASYFPGDSVYQQTDSGI